MSRLLGSLHLLPHFTGGKAEAQMRKAADQMDAASSKPRVASLACLVLPVRARENVAALAKYQRGMPGLRLGEAPTFTDRPWARGAWLPLRPLGGPLPPVSSAPHSRHASRLGKPGCRFQGASPGSRAGAGHPGHTVFPGRSQARGSREWADGLHTALLLTKAAAPR